MRLKSHLGSPSETFLAMESALRRLLVQLHDNPNRSAALMKGIASFLQCGSICSLLLHGQSAAWLPHEVTWEA